ncbi:hypothetical protein SEUCBS139899_000506 [Sporothrix eucalyptigena]
MSLNTVDLQMQRISEISDRTAYLILMELCRDNSVALQRTVALADKFDAFNRTKARNEDGEIAQTTTDNTKRKAGEDDDSMICIDCKAIFTEDTRSGEAVCCYHNGVLIPDEDGGFWDDHDDYFGPIDTDEMKLDCPEGFKWECCDAENGSAGCQKRSFHVAAAGIRKRPRVANAGIPTGTAVMETAQEIAQAAPIEISSDEESPGGPGNDDDGVADGAI